MIKALFVISDHLLLGQTRPDKPRNAASASSCRLGCSTRMRLLRSAAPSTGSAVPSLPHARPPCLLSTSEPAAWAPVSVTADPLFPAIVSLRGQSVSRPSVLMRRSRSIALPQGSSQSHRSHLPDTEAPPRHCGAATVAPSSVSCCSGGSCGLGDATACSWPFPLREGSTRTASDHHADVAHWNTIAAPVSRRPYAACRPRCETEPGMLQRRCAVGAHGEHVFAGWVGLARRQPRHARARAACATLCRASWAGPVAHGPSEPRCRCRSGPRRHFRPVGQNQIEILFLFCFGLNSSLNLKISYVSVQSPKNHETSSIILLNSCPTQEKYKN
jgi:hypothetical protein